VASVSPDATLSSDGANQSSSGSCTDKAGNTASATASGINIDKTPPTITASASPAPNGNGWNNTNVTVHYTCSDGLSGVDTLSADDTITTESSDQSRTGSCTDKAGNLATATASGINIDKTSPTILASATAGGNPYTSGTWTNQTVTVHFTCNDGLSGVASCPADQVISSDTSSAGTDVSGTATDNADNSAASNTINVKVDKTPPTITASASPAPNGNGWNNTNVTVHYTCSDGLSGVASTSPDATLSSNGANQSSTGSCTDVAGNSASATASGINIDKTAPTITASASPAPNGNGWNNTNVTVHYTCSDGLSGVANTSPDATLSSNGANQSSTGSCTDEAGNTASATASGINIDKTAPTITASASPAANANGWNNTNVTVSFSCSDSLSGVGTVDGPATITTEGPNQARSGACTDKAGNTASAAATGINIDKTSPTITASRSPLANAYGWNNTNVTVSFTCTDSVSGVASVDPAVTLSGEGTNQSASGNCTDKAGNSASATQGGINIDTSNPSVSASRAPLANANGWNNTNVTVSFSCTDSLSGVASSASPVTLSSEGANQSASGNCTDKAGNTASATQSGINIDMTAPTISLRPAGDSCSLPGSNSWCRATQTVGFSASDALSGLANPAQATFTQSTIANGSAIYIGSGTVADLAGNVAASISAGPYKIDSMPPSLSPTVAPNPVVLNGSATASPNASDLLSGIDNANTGCNPVNTSNPGLQTDACHATDNAGNTNTTNASYTVSYNFIGFLSPLNSDTSIVNVGNAGRTYPVKYQLLDANNAYVTNAVAGTTINVVKVACDQINGAATDAIDYASTTGGTALRYDTTANQYIYNWATPSTKNSCYRLIVTPPSGIQHVALFHLN
jgi:hypothetical protein